METAAKTLGAELVSRERALDGGFRQGTVTPSRLAADTEAIGLLQARLRAVHLTAHVEMRGVLSPAQIDVYDRLRGHGGGNVPAAAGHVTVRDETAEPGRISKAITDEGYAVHKLAA